MKAHQLAELLLGGPNHDVFDHVYDATYMPVIGVEHVAMIKVNRVMGGDYEIDEHNNLKNAVILLGGDS